MEKQETCEECNSRFQIWMNAIKHFFNKKQKLLPETEAFNSTTYGRCMTKEQYITQKQVNINASIKERINGVGMGDTDFERYFLVLSFNKTEEECSEEIFKPFKEIGYKIVKVSNQLDILKDTNVYLLTWKKGN